MVHHPIPQNITGFEFKMIGMLTLKQFGYLVGAAIVCSIFYFSFSGILRWLLIAPVAGLGAAFAFLPLNGMSFDKWIVAFLSSILTPSRRVWRKEPVTISFLAPEFSYFLRRAVKTPTTSINSRSKLDAYIATLKKEDKPNPLDAIEKTRLDQLHLALPEVKTYANTEGGGK
jgi:hypothetical protein